MIHLRSSLMNNPLLKINMKVMRFSGLATFDDQRYPIVHKCQGMLIMIIITTFFVTQFIDLYQVFGDIGEMTKNAPSTFLAAIIIAQCYKFMYYSSDLTTILFNEIDTNLNGISNLAGGNKKDQLNISKIVTKRIRNINLLTIIYWFLSFIYLQIKIVLITWRYLQANELGDVQEKNNSNFLLVRSWYPVDVYQNFVIIHIIQIIICHLGFLVVTLTCTTIVLMMNYVIAMIQILQYRCETLTDNIEDVETMDERDWILKQKLINIVSAHLELGRFVQNLNKLISTSMFFIFAIFSVLLCALLFQMKFGADFLIPLSFIVNIIVILLTLYWHANEIIYHSSDLPTSIYFCDWCTCSIKFKKLILIFMSCSRRPLTLSALYFTMNLDVLIKILKTSYSYFTLLSHISDRY